MNKKLVASVLLAGLAAAYPVYAEDDRTPDEYNPEAKYVSPLAEPPRRAVNDRRAIQQSESDVVPEPGLSPLQQNGAAVNRARPGQPNGADQAKGVSPSPQEAVKGKIPGPGGSTSASLQEARKAAEIKLSETDENFEPELFKTYPGFEYQARKYASEFIEAPPGTATEGNNTDSGRISSEQALPEEGEGKGAPLIITGEDAHYSSSTGDFIIQGNVRLVQGDMRICSTKAVGNAEKGDVWLLEGGTLQETSNTTHARWAHYNFNTKTGELRQIEGRGDKDFYKAPHAIIENGMMILDQGGSTTRCPAVKHTPCLEVKAKTITLVPNKRIVARGVKVYVKGVHVYSRDVWMNEFGSGRQMILPRAGWKDKKGFYISLDYEQPVGNPLAKNPTKAYMHQVYYSKSGYKPFYGLRHDEHDFYVRLHDGYIYDSDDDTLDEGIWLHKKMDWGLFLKPHRIAPGLPLTYEGYVTHGLWQYTNRTWSSWHTEKVVHLRHDRIYPLGDKKLYLDLLLGRKWVNESNPQNTAYGKSLNSMIYDGVIGYEFSPKWNAWTRYHNEHKTSYNFSLGQPGFAKEWRTGVAWKPDDRNTVTMVHQYNADHGSPYYGNYSTAFSWVHRFCCEVLTISYQRKHYNNKNEWNVKFDLLNW